MSNKTRGWTAERRAKQAQTCHKTRPSDHSTGAKSRTGKRKSAQNALKHGGFSRDMMCLKALMREQRKFLLNSAHVSYRKSVTKQVIGV
ncbi:MAG: hypothetical protein JKY11_05540 [Alphaproteobacteria bacterium]|nr:hypothetical protein [Alphaproteobacteria bacterium]